MYNYTDIFYPCIVCVTETIPYIYDESRKIFCVHLLIKTIIPVFQIFAKTMTRLSANRLSVCPFQILSRKRGRKKECSTEIKREKRKRYMRRREGEIRLDYLK